MGNPIFYNATPIPIYGIISRKDLPYAPSGVVGFEIIKIPPKGFAGMEVDIDAVTNIPPKMGANGSLFYPTSTCFQKFQNYFRNYSAIITDTSWGGGSPITAGEMNGGYPIIDPDGFSIIKYPVPDYVRGIQNFLSKMFGN